MLIRSGESGLATDLIHEAPARVGGPLPPRFYLVAGSFLEREADARTALELYESLATLHPEDPATVRALFRRGEILRRNGAVRDAREAFLQARAHPACGDAVGQSIAHALAEMENAAVRSGGGAGRERKPPPGRG